MEDTFMLKYYSLPGGHTAFDIRCWKPISNYAQVAFVCLHLALFIPAVHSFVTPTWQPCWQWFAHIAWFAQAGNRL